MAVPKVRVPESTMNPDKSGSSLRAPGGPSGSQNGSTMGNMQNNLKEVSGGFKPPSLGGNLQMPRPPVRQLPGNNKQAALRRLQKKYRMSGGPQ